MGDGTGRGNTERAMRFGGILGVDKPAPVAVAALCAADPAHEHGDVYEC